METVKISEFDLERIFKYKAKKRRKTLRVLSYFIYLLIIYLAVFVAINYKSLKSNLIFWYKTEYKNEIIADTKPATIKQSNTVKVSNIPAIADNHIFIASINVNAPISWKINNTSAEVKTALQNGVIHINGTALPGENGNVFITGHSSDLPWNKGDYKNIFSLLSRLVVGDIVQIKYQENSYFYRVSGIETVSPDNVSVMKPTSEPILTLMTCTPVGTSLKRLIITSKQISPVSNKNNSAQNGFEQQKLPKVR